MVKFGADDFYLQEWGTKEGADLASAGFRQFYTNRLEDVLNDNTEIKFSYFSGHDTTVSMYLAALGFP